MLWANVPVGEREWTDVALASSSPLPVNIDFVLTKSVSSPCRIGGILRALEGTSRAKKISLVEAWDAEHTHFLSEAFAMMSRHPAPLLETVDIFANPGDDLIDLPDELFCGTVPSNLRTLVLRSVGFGPSQPLVSAPLTTLHLCSCRTNMSIESMLSIIACIPTLEDLSLEDTDFTDLNGDPLEERTCTELSFQPHSITLPRLRQLSFFDTVYMITTVMLYLSIPHDVRLDLDCDCQSTTIEEATTAMAIALEDHFSPMEAAGLAFKELSISSSDNSRESVTFKLSSPSSRQARMTEQAQFPASFSLGWVLQPDEIARSVTTLGELLPGIGHITSVHAAHDIFSDDGVRSEFARRVCSSSAAWSEQTLSTGSFDILS